MLLSYISPILTYIQSYSWVPITTKTWRHNERHYGALQGYNKDKAFEELNIDQELVMECVGVMQRVLLA